METLKIAVSSLKSQLAQHCNLLLIEKNYGVKACNSMLNFNLNLEKLKLIYLENIDYLNLTDIQINRVIKNNFKN